MHSSFVAEPRFLRIPVGVLDLLELALDLRREEDDIDRFIVLARCLGVGRGIVGIRICSVYGKTGLSRYIGMHQKKSQVSFRNSLSPRLLRFGTLVGGSTLVKF